MTSPTSSSLLSSFKEIYPDFHDVDPNFFSLFDFEEKEYPHPSFIWNFSPSSDSYYSPLNNVFLHQVESMDELKGFPIVLSRDGLLPLLWFFERMSPPSFPCRILIHRPFADFVPENWRPFIGTYQLVSRKKSISIMTVDKIFIHCLVSKGYLPLKFFRSQLKFMLREVEKQQLDIRRFDLFLSFRDDPYYRKESDKFNALVVKEALTILGDRARFMSQREMLNRISYGEYKVFEIGKGYFVADNFINFLALSRGAELLMLNNLSLAGRKKEEGEPAMVDLSPFHSMAINERLPVCKLSQQQREELEEMRNQALMDRHSKYSANQVWPESFIWYAEKALVAYNESKESI